MKQVRTVSGSPVKLVVEQDGPDFYDIEGVSLFSVNFRVPDGDVAAARRARIQFINWCKAYGWLPEFEGEGSS